MKIYFIGQKGLPAISGGVEKHVEELASHLVQDGHDVYAYTRFNYSDKNKQEYHGIKLINLPSLSTKNLDAISHTLLACLDIIFRRKNIDIIHFNSIGPGSLMWLVKIFKRKTPIIFTFHSKCYLHKKWGLLARLYLKISEWISVYTADEIITISEELHKYVKENYKIDSKYIPNGANVSPKSSPKIIKKWGLEKDNYIVAISRLIKIKGINYLIDAYNNLQTDKKLVIVGGGSFTDDYVLKLKKQAKDNPNIIFTGRQTGDALSELYSNAYLFVSPSESEGLSLSLLEAMSYGRGVLVSDIKANRSAMEGFGFTFANKSSEDLKNKLKLLLEEPKLVNSIGEKARLHVSKNYNWANISIYTADLYSKALTEKNRKLLFAKNSQLAK